MTLLSRTAALALVVSFATSAEAQVVRDSLLWVVGPEAEVSRLGNFEIQDLMLRAEYGEPSARNFEEVKVTLTAPDLRARSVTLVAQAGRRTQRLDLRRDGDGTFTGQGPLPAPGDLTALGLRLGDERGLDIGMPPSLAEGGRSEGRADGWSIEIVIDSDGPEIVIVIKG